MNNSGVNVQVANPPRVNASDSLRSWRGTADGAGIVQDWETALKFEGREGIISLGSETAPLSAVAYNQDQPEFTLAGATAVTLVVHRVDIHLESFAGTDNEVIFWTVTNEIAAGTSSAVTEGPTSTLVGGSFALNSDVVARQLHTANVTQTNYIEKGRAIEPLADGQGGGKLVDVLPEPVILRGGGSFGFGLSATSTQPTFYATIWYYELPVDSTTA